MTGWKEDKKWSDKFLHEIKGIIGQTFIVEPPQEEDTLRNTDLIVLKLDSIRIACRIRKNEYLNRYKNEFTIRSGRPSGKKTELAKIIEGWGDYFFYGFSDEKEEKLESWRIINLSAFRLWHSKELVNGKGMLPGMLRENNDGSSSFMAFHIAWMPECIYKESAS